jgi:hypothetical protein
LKTKKSGNQKIWQPKNLATLLLSAPKNMSQLNSSELVLGA